MAARPDGPSYHLAWCLGGFVFPVAVTALGLAFERGNPPDEAELAGAWVHPELLSRAVIVLLVLHAAAGLLAVVRWPICGGVWVATAAQLACSSVAGFLAGMAVRGEWL